MVPAAGTAFVLLARVIEGTAGAAHGLWPLAPSGYWWLGVAAGIGFMAGELPNSFVKRQLGIAPGEAPPPGLARPLCFLADRLDSIVGMLTAVSLAVPISVRTWGVVLVIGPAIHYLFSHLLFVVGVKARSA
jgi:CDP-2,3-bis-(O-geranylgeranyl)-sn-glycerol synthase